MTNMQSQIEYYMRTRNLPGLFELTLSSETEVRAQAYEALGHFKGETSVISCLLSGIYDPDPQAKLAAIHAIANVGTAGIYERVRSRMRHESDTETRKALQTALDSLK